MQTVPHRQQLRSSSAGPDSPQIFIKMHAAGAWIWQGIALSYRVVYLKRVPNRRKYRASFGFHLGPEELTIKHSLLLFGRGVFVLQLNSVTL